MCGGSRHRTAPADAATAEADARKVDYRAALDAESRRGARIGVMRFLVDGYSAETRAAFEQSLTALRAGVPVDPIVQATAPHIRLPHEPSEGVKPVDPLSHQE